VSNLVFRSRRPPRLHDLINCLPHLDDTLSDISRTINETRVDQAVVLGESVFQAHQTCVLVIDALGVHGISGDQ
jgi:hypothetical protein